MKYSIVPAVLGLVFVSLLSFAGPQQVKEQPSAQGQEQAQSEAQVPAQQPQPEPPRAVDPAPAPVKITLPSGTTISVRIADQVNSNHDHEGDLITGIVDPSVFIADHVVIPRGTEAHVRLVENRKGGRLHGEAAVSLELIGLVMNKERLDVDSDDYRKKQSAIAAKVKDAGEASASSGTSAATSPNPAGGAVGPIIAVFRAAKIQLQAGTRIPFTLTTPFTFEEPAEQPTPAPAPR